MSNHTSLSDLELFVEVARHGSFSRASNILAMPGATLSRRIAAMEQRLGIRLFNRSTRRVELTEPAQRYFDRCASLVDEARLAHESLQMTIEQPVGHVRISAPVDFAIHWLGLHLCEFGRLHPGISFELDLSPHHRDLMADQIDVAIRLGPVRGEQLIVRRVGEIKMAIFAAPAYLDRHQRPSRPEDLVEHQCIFIKTSERLASWHFINKSEAINVEVTGQFCLNNISMVRVLAERGMGVAILPVLMARDSVIAGRLEQVLPEFELSTLPVHLVLASRLQPAAIRTFIEFLAARLVLD